MRPGQQAMTVLDRIQNEAANAILTVAGWDSEPTSFGALASRPSGVEVLLTCDKEEVWTCEIGNYHTGKGNTAETAISKVFPKYREYILGLAADVADAKQDGHPDKEYQKYFRAMIGFNK
jgi:hypothetical protein